MQVNLNTGYCMQFLKYAIRISHGNVQNQETFFLILAVIKSDNFDNAAIVQDDNQEVLNYVPKMHREWSDKTKHVLMLPETAAGWFMCSK